MMKSSHPDVALWSYESASRGYFGYHLRAKSREARRKLHQKLVGLAPSGSALLRLGAQLRDPISAGWARTAYPYLSLTRAETPTEGEGVRLALADDSWPLLLTLLAREGADGEEAVNVATPSGHAPLWVWPDAA